VNTEVLVAQGETFHDVAGIIHAGGAACSLSLGLLEATYKGSKVGRFLSRMFPTVFSAKTARLVAAAALVGGGAVLGATALWKGPIPGPIQPEPAPSPKQLDSTAKAIVVTASSGRVLTVPPFLNTTDRRAPIDVDVATGDGIGAATRSVKVERYGRDAQDRTLQLLAETKPEGVTLIDRSRFDRFLDEFKFSESGMVSQESAIRVGRQLGARYVLLGEIKKLSITDRHGATPDGQMQTTFVAETEISFKLQDVETGEVVGTAKAAGKCTKLSRLPDADMISSAFDEAFEKLSKDPKMSAALKKLAEMAE
jgi:hypothetical protein